MKKYPIPENEVQRLIRMRKYDLLGLGKESDFDIFAKSAAALTGSAGALIALMEEDIQRIQSCVGLEIETVDRRDTVCQYTIMSAEAVIINDTQLDERTAENAIINAGGIRFYAGVPVLDQDGFALGTLCVIDFTPKSLTTEQIASLFELAATASKLYTLKKKQSESGYFTDIFALTQNMICVLDEDFNIKEINPAFETLFNIINKDFINQYFPKIVAEDSDEVYDSLIAAKSCMNQSLITRIQSPMQELIILQWHFRYEEKYNEIFAFGQDITAEINERTRLEISELKFRNFFENSLGLMSMHDMDGNILKVNEKGREMLGYELDEVSNINLSDLIPSENRELLKTYLNQIKIKGELDGLMTMRTKWGEEMYFLYHNVVEFDAKGNPYVASMALNMTERRKLEVDLIHTKQILEQTNAVAQVGGWEVDIENGKVFHSMSAKQILNVKSDDQLSLNSSFSLYDEQSEDVLQNAFNSAVNEGIEYDLELKLKGNGVSGTWVRVKGIPEFQDGKCIRVFGIIQDINKSKTLYLELENKESMLQAFVRHIPAAVAMFDNNFDIISVSKSWMEEFSVTHKDLQKTRNLFALFPSVPESRKAVYYDALNGKPYTNDNELMQFPNHETVQHFNWEVRPWHLSDGSIGGVIISAQNITQSVLINEELKAAKKQADSANHAKSEFLANMSHEIRTPLNGVIGFSDLLIRTPLNEVQQQYLKYINESGASLLNIINDILDFSKIESDKLELFIDQSNVYEITGQVVNVVLFQAQYKNLELLLNVEPGLPLRIWVDDSRLKQVLINLMGNAVKFTDSGEIELKVQLLNKTQENITLRFSVRDTGIGIAAEKQGKIFNAFTQEDSSVSKRYGGTGLGLTISNNLLKYMDSKLQLESVLGEGTTFYFDLIVPYEDTQDEQTDVLEIKRAMIVDDNANNRVILQHMLQFKNIETTLVKNGAEALQLLLEGNEYDLILVDYHMPVLSGIETISKIRNIFDQKGMLVPLIILHTSSEEHEVITNLRNDDTVVGLMKPIKSDELYNAIHRSVQKAKKVAESNPITTTQFFNDAKFFSDNLLILIADDNTVNMTLNIRMLSDLLPQAHILQAGHGLQALDACKEYNVDLILMDVQMPIMDGIEATREIRKLDAYKQTPIIGLSAGTTPFEKDKCMSAGMSYFLPKPIRLENLQDVLLKFLSKISKIEHREKQQQSNINSNISILDIQKLEENYGDDQEFKSYFLDLVVTELLEVQRNLSAEVYEKGSEYVKTALHKLKGTSSSIGLIQLTAKASDLEKQLIYDENSVLDLDILIIEIQKGIMEIERIKNDK